jgi:serine/threonine protein kinase
MSESDGDSSGRPGTGSEDDPGAARQSGECLPQMSDLSQSPPAVLQPSNAGLRKREPDTAGPATEVPESIGPYKVKRLIGESNFQVFLAHDEQNNRDVAIKVIRPDDPARQARQESLAQEADCLRDLNHQNIVQFFDYRREDGTKVGSSGYIVMEYVEGETLEQLLAQDSVLSTERLVEILAKVARAAAHAHTFALVHRDLKPSNILIDEERRPKICDFGVALDEEALSLRGPTVAGTVPYMAPEQTQSEAKLDGRTDIWALGVILYRGLTKGHLPFCRQAIDKRACFQQIRKGDFKPPRQWDSNISQGLEAICLKCLKVRKDDRFQTANDLADELETWLSVFKSQTEANPVQFKGLRAFDIDDQSFFPKLLPGRRIGNLPEEIYFWKSRIENPTATFRVGVVHAPSGAGKSSFIHAGLLPKLDKTLVRAVVISARSADTEYQLERELRRLVKHVPSETTGDLAAVMQLVKGPRSRGARKVLLVLDQFEQWLQGRQGRLREEKLVEALRQCDGDEIQALLVVRDEYWQPTERLFDAMDMPLSTQSNVRSIESFDSTHARSVLEYFGHALHRLPSSPDKSSEDFLSKAIDGLIDSHGYVNPLRLNEFVQAVGERPWTPATLSRLGGMEQIGIRFIQELFDFSKTLPDATRAAAEKTLRLLVPPAPANMRDRPRSEQELRTAAGIGSDEFDALIKLLDGTFHLISSVDAMHSTVDEGATTTHDLRHYQLTHDGLVSSLRAWFDKNDSATPQGQARVLLKNRAALWNQKHEIRHLPTPWEQLRIRRYIAKTDWTNPEERMMAQATKVLTVLLSLSVLLVIGGVVSYRYLKASGLVQQLALAETAQVPRIIREIEDYKDFAPRPLRKLVAMSTPQSRTNLHARLALLLFDESQVPELSKRLIEAASPTDLGILRDALQPYASRLTKTLWESLEADSVQRKRPMNPSSQRPVRAA